MQYKKRLTWLALVLLFAAVPAGATQIRNICTLKGSEQSRITGIGVVVGLNGTGDGKFGPAHKAVLAAVMRNIDATATKIDLSDAKSIALVAVTATIPPQGVRSGVDLLDLTVATANSAKSLKGGVLLDTVLFSPGTNGRAFAVGSGNITLEDEEHPTRAKVVKGAHMVRDVPSNNLDDKNRITLVIDKSKASYQLSNFIAQTINGLMVQEEDGEAIAVAIDQKNVRIQVPKVAMPNLSEFIAQIMTTSIDSEVASGGARVIINEAQGTIAMTKDVELSPVIISHKGMTIQILKPEPEPDVNNPKVETKTFFALDPDKRGGPRLRQLLDALNTLNVPAKDRIAIIKELHDAGLLHAKLTYK